jgi:hypothetical protein
MAKVNTAVKVQRGDGHAGAVFSEDGLFRYQLWRREEPGEPSILWVLLNPSTADEQQLDPTLRRVRGFSNGWGFKNWEVCNLFAFRATDPHKMKRAADPVGPANNQQIEEAARRCAEIVVGWGGGGWHLGRDRTVMGILTATGKPIWRLGPLAKTGTPKHPLYVPGSTLAVRHDWHRTPSVVRPGQLAAAARDAAERV